MQLDSSTRKWRLRILPRGTVPASDCFQVNLCGPDETTWQQQMEVAYREAESRLDPSAGRLLQAVWVDRADGGQLLLVIHHLAVDGVSWRILVPNLAAALAALAKGSTPRLEPEVTSFRAWARHLAEQAQGPALLAELPAWEAIVDGAMPLLPGLGLDPKADTMASTGLAIQLPVAPTSALLTAVPAAFYARINDVLLTALALAVEVWRRQRGLDRERPVLIDLEGHGREPMDSMIDLSRTVGWFTSLYPVSLDVGSGDLDQALAGGPGIARALKRVKEQLRAVPGQGLGYGLLRYLNPEVGPRLAGRQDPQIAFNYLGRFASGDSSDQSIASAAMGGGGAEAIPSPI